MGQYASCVLLVHERHGRFRTDYQNNGHDAKNATTKQERASLLGVHPCVLISDLCLAASRFFVHPRKPTALTSSPARQHISIAALRLQGSGLEGLTCCDCRSTSRPFLHSPAELQARMVAATANPAGRIPCTYISANSIIARFQLPACGYTPEPWL